MLLFQFHHVIDIKLSAGIHYIFMSSLFLTHISNIGNIASEEQNFYIFLIIVVDRDF